MLVFRTRQIAVRCTLRRGIWPDGAFGGPRCECGGRATSISANEPRSATDDVATSDSTNSRLETRVLQCPAESCGNPIGHTVLGFRPGALLLRAQTWIFFVGQIHCCEYFTLDVRKTCTALRHHRIPDPQTLRRGGLTLLHPLLHLTDVFHRSAGALSAHWPVGPCACTDQLVDNDAAGGGVSILACCMLLQPPCVHPTCTGRTFACRCDCVARSWLMAQSF